MAQLKRESVQFGNFQASGHEQLAGASPLAVNVIVDAAGAVHRRPGIIPRDDWADTVSLESPIVALHSTAGGRVFAVDAPNPSSSRIYELAGASVHNLSTLPEGQVFGGRRPIIAETEAMLVITAGGPPQKVLLGTPAQSSFLGGGPPRATHIIALSGRLLANDLPPTDLIRYTATAYGSSTAGHEDWTSPSAGFFNAGARPDPVVALHENTNEIFAFGSTNLQILTATDDPANRFARVNTREFGCSAPYSVVKFEQNFGFVDAHRRIVLTDGRDYQIISSDIQQTLDDIPDFSDAFGYRVTLGPVDALCWCSPRDGRTFVYQVPTKSWSLWQSWDDRVRNFGLWPIRCAVRIPETGEMLVGGAVGTGTGQVFALSNHAYIDEADDGDRRKVMARVDTGYIDRGTSGRKLCRALRLTWRGGQNPPMGSPGGDPSFDTAAFIEWRDEGGPWEHSRQIELDPSRPSTETILRSLGVYRRRQWRVTFSGASELVLARAEEEFELLAV